ncbi:MAG TPA: hypothetical protein VEJ46_17320 [Candidatus Acidoferrum sp.]|nr:hypothetical protein [Candidatus Acidoferrum sp.]
MSSRIRFLLPLAGLWLVPSAFATDLAYVKCAVNQDRVWVYESLNSFDVEARLRCGEPVEILHRVRGYVKIRTESGVEGYVPDSAFPDLPALPDDTQTPATAAVQRSVAAAAAKPAPVAPNPVAVAAAATQPVTALSSPSAIPQPPAAPAVAASVAQPSVAKTSAPAKPAISASAKAPVQAKVAPAPTNAKPAVTVAKNAHAASAEPSPAFDSAPAARLVHAAPAAEAVKISIEPVSAKADSVAMVRATSQPAAPGGESEDYPDTQVVNESADPACHIYFAAYGLAPSQYKWMAENRRKEFAGICPAPDLAHVDFVVLFTHDSDTYTYAMPTPVHTDRNGFSDFSPLTTVDTALVSMSEVQKARYEFVWVFRMTRGAFDPEKFSPRRRPQFATYVKGSRASSRAIEDAFSFVETQEVTR